MRDVERSGIILLSDNLARAKASTYLLKLISQRCNDTRPDHKISIHQRRRPAELIQDKRHLSKCHFYQGVSEPQAVGPCVEQLTLE